ncbi:MAG: lysine 2,3-aminomutase [Pseudomonadota bacterium]|nr:MAG: lysine 2,3-aminomutase [Pseudomonadota bacterium]
MHIFRDLKSGGDSGYPGHGEPRFHAYTERQFDQIPHLERLSAEQRFAMHVVARVLPFRVNDYVLEHLIDWDNVPDDPMFQLVFPQPGMIAPAHYDRVAGMVNSGADKRTLKAAVHAIHLELNPHPAEQRTLNVPYFGDHSLEGAQHKYRETLLFFPGAGQTCHAYCSFCFRWAQFVQDKELRISSREASQLQTYLKAHRHVTDLLITGGDPMVMKTHHLVENIEPLLQPEFDHVQTIRIGTKALSYWPYRFTTDADADDLLRLFERVVKAGKHLAFMAHYNHWRELEPAPAREAIRRVQDTGAVIRMQGPLLAHINDDPAVWGRMWREQVKLGIVPYYMFVERDTGARRYFEVPLVRAWEIYRDAMQQVSGLGRTARGPSMSAGPGKVEVQGVTEIQGEKVFVLRFIQGRDPDWVERPFFAKFDPAATWLDELQPAFGESHFFFEREYEGMRGGTVNTLVE